MSVSVLRRSKTIHFLYIYYYCSTSYSVLVVYGVCDQLMQYILCTKCLYSALHTKNLFSLDHASFLKGAHVERVLYIQISTMLGH